MTYIRSFYQYISLKINLITLKRFSWIIITLIFMLVVFSVFRLAVDDGFRSISFRIDLQFFFFVLAGFLAQLIDGALGMAYGVSCSTMLLAFNVPPVVSSASVHLSEVFTSGISGLSHLRFKNVHRQLLLKLILPGILGAGLGAFLLSEYFTGGWVKPIVSVYLMVLGMFIVRKVFLRFSQSSRKVRHISRLALAGGFLDAIGGGGWGPIVVSHLIHQGVNPRRTIGSANTAEFFVALISSAVFMTFIKISNWQPIFGILLGGMIAAPLAAFMVKIIRPKPLMMVVGLLIILISAYNLYSSIPFLKTTMLASFF